MIDVSRSQWGSAFLVSFACGVLAWSVAAQDAPVRERFVTIGASGDMLAHINVVRSGRELGFDHLFAELAPEIGEDEIAFVNLETPLSERIDPVSASPPILGAPADFAEALHDAGIDVVSVANNHAFDQGAEGLVETLDALSSAHVAAVGASGEEANAHGPVIIERGGVRVAFVAFTALLNRPGRQRRPTVYLARDHDDDVETALTAARANADIVVLSMHWSVDFITRPNRTLRRRAERFVEAGADVILAHGPHLLWPVERLDSTRGEAVCAFSLGNFISNQGLLYVPRFRPTPDLDPAAYLPGTRDAVWLRIRVGVAGDRVRIASIEGVPLFTHNNHRARRRASDPYDIRVRPVRDIDEPLRTERREAIADALGDEVTLLE